MSKPYLSQNAFRTKYGVCQSTFAKWIDMGAPTFELYKGASRRVVVEKTFLEWVKNEIGIELFPVSKNN